MTCLLASRVCARRSRQTGPRRNRVRGASKVDAVAAAGDQGDAGRPQRESRRTRKARARGLISPEGRIEHGAPLCGMAGTRGGAASVEPPADLPRFNRENDDGNVEYKLRLKSPTPFRFQQLVRGLGVLQLQACGPATQQLSLDAPIA